MMKWFVWETEEGGGVVIERYTAKGAKRAFRRMTMGRGTGDDTPLSACEATPELMAELELAEES